LIYLTLCSYQNLALLLSLILPNFVYPEVFVVQYPNEMLEHL
jgi:hypothetical protein